MTEAWEELARLGRELGGQVTRAFAEVFPAVEVPVTRKTVGERMREMEREIEILTESRDRLQDSNNRLAARIAELVQTNRESERQFQGKVVELADEWDARVTAETNLRCAEEELTQLRRVHHEMVNGQREKPVGLSEILLRMNEVITAHAERLSPTSGTARTVDIRRRMLAKYSVAHDMEHLDDGYLLLAAQALVTGEYGMWPWGSERFNRVQADGTQLPTAAALIIAHYDAAQAGGAIA